MKNHFSKQDLYYWTKLLKKRREGWGIREKAKHLRKNKFIFFDIAGKGVNSIPCYNAKIRSYEKISRKLFTPFSHFLKVKASSCCLVSRHSVSVRHNSASKPGKIGEHERLSRENVGRKKYEFQMFFFSQDFEESRVTHVSENYGDLSLRDTCLGKPRSTNERYFI